MVDREFWLPRPEPYHAAYHPATGTARIDRQSTVNQFDGDIYVFAKIGESVGSLTEDAWVVTGNPQRLPGEIDTLAAV